MKKKKVATGHSKPVIKTGRGGSAADDTGSGGRTPPPAKRATPAKAGG